MTGTQERSCKERVALFMAILYLAVLGIAVGILWWVTIVGSNPFSITNVGTLNNAGSAETRFRHGDVVGVHRKVCSTKQAAYQQFPALQDAKGFTYALQPTMIQAAAGCIDTRDGFVVPDYLPPGEYTYISTVRYQTNLVGRDEHHVFPPLRIRIAR